MVIWPAPQYVSDGVVVEPDGIAVAYSCNDHLAWFTCDPLTAVVATDIVS